MNKKYYGLVLTILMTMLYSRSMEFTSCKTYVKIEKNLAKGEEFGLLALEKEPDNAYIPYYIGRFIYRPQKKVREAGEMFVKALNMTDTRLEQSFRIGSGENQTFIKTVHEAIALYGTDWFNYGVEAEQKEENEKAIQYLEMASIFDPDLKASCYSTIALIYFNINNMELAFEYIDDAISTSNNEASKIEYKMMKILFLRNLKEIDAAFEIYNSLSKEKLSAAQEYNSFLLHMDNEDCLSAINIGEELFLGLEEDIKTPMNLLSEFAFNLAACFNHEADIKYNQIIEYIGQADRHSDEITKHHIEACEFIKEFYSSAKDYFRLSLDYDENPNQTTKDYKRKMRANIRKIDDTIIPALMGL